MTDTVAAPTLVLHFVRATPDQPGANTTWTLQATTPAEAAAHLDAYRDGAETTVTLTTADGRWIGAARTGQGTVNVGWTV